MRCSGPYVSDISWCAKIIPLSECQGGISLQCPVNVSCSNVTGSSLLAYCDSCEDGQSGEDSICQSK